MNDSTRRAAAKLKRILADPILWARFFLQIANKTGKIVPFQFNPQQRQLVRDLQKYNIVLKSRQLGITSVACALSLYFCHREPGAVCLLMSYSQDSARGIFEKLKQMWSAMPEAIRLPELTNNRSELKFSNGSRIVVATCGTKDVARGLTLKFVHLSEYAFFRNDRAKKNLLAIEQALRPDGVIVVESTANGLNHFSELWQKAENGGNMYQPHFFGWVQDKKMFADEYRLFCQRYVQLNGKLPERNELDETEQALMEQGATIEQIVWRRMKIANSTPEEFRQEFPSNPLEAFVSTGRNFFNTSLISDRAAAVRPSIRAPEQFRKYTSLTFWRLPEAGRHYYIGVDTAEGLGQGADHSAVEIIDGDGWQVCELYSDTIKPYQLAALVLELAVFYNNGLCVVEKASAGHIVVDKLRNEYHYPNLYKSKQYDAAGRMKRRPGWETTSKSRPIMLGDFAEQFEHGEVWINSKTLLGEMKLFVNKEGRAEHAGNTGDDCIFAFAMALQGIKSGLWYG